MTCSAPDRRRPPRAARGWSTSAVSIRPTRQLTRGSWRRRTAWKATRRSGSSSGPRSGRTSVSSPLMLALMALFWRFRRIEEKRSREYARNLEHEATHDHLTGLPNRRRLMDDLDAAGRAAGCSCSSTSTASRPTTTPSATSRATSCCARLEPQARATPSATRGVAYRLGGDEFCVARRALRRRGRRRARERVASRRSSEDGEGFARAAPPGAACVVPDEAATPRRGADAWPTSACTQHKGVRPRPRPSSRRATSCCACSPSASPTCTSTSASVAALARAVGERLGLRRDRARRPRARGGAPRHRQDRNPRRDPEQARAARRRRVGVHAARTPSQASGSSWPPPALAAAARVVRSSHERFDGGRLSGRAGRRGTSRSGVADHLRLRLV